MPTCVAEPYEPADTVVLERAIVTGAEPLNDVPDNPVPIVKVDVVLAVKVVEPPRLTVLPLMVIELFCRPLFWIAELIAEAGMLIVAFAAVVS